MQHATCNMVVLLRTVSALFLIIVSGTQQQQLAYNNYTVTQHAINTRIKRGAVRLNDQLQQCTGNIGDEITKFRSIEPLISDPSLRQQYSHLVDNLGTEVATLTRRHNADGMKVEDTLDSVRHAIRKFLSELSHLKADLSKRANLISETKLNFKITENARQMKHVLEKLKEHAAKQSKDQNRGFLDRKIREVFDISLKLRALKPFLSEDNMLDKPLNEIKLLNDLDSFDKVIIGLIKQAEELQLIIASRKSLISKDYHRVMRRAINRLENDIVSCIDIGCPEYRVIKVKRPHEILMLTERLLCHLNHAPLKDKNSNNMYVFSANTLMHLANQAAINVMKGKTEELPQIAEAMQKISQGMKLDKHNFENNMDSYCVAKAIIKNVNRTKFEVIIDKDSICSKTDFYCYKSSECVSELKVCDENPDCRNGEDELDCDYGSIKCGVNFVYCDEKASKKCVDVSPGCACLDKDTAIDPMSTKKPTTTTTSTTTTTVKSTTTTSPTTTTTTTKKPTTTTTTTTTTKKPTTTTAKKPTTSTIKSTTTPAIQTSTVYEPPCPQLAVCKQVSGDDRDISNRQRDYYAKWRGNSKHELDYHEQFYYY